MIKLRKLLACLMIVCMALSLMPLAAFATEGEAGETIMCEQHSFVDGKCVNCKYECPHTNIVDGVCVDCEMTVEQDTVQDDSGEVNGGDANNDPAAAQTGENGEGGEDDSAEDENKVPDYTAQIGENKFETLGEALAAMQPGDTVTLLDNVTENLILKTDGTIDLGDFSITGVVAVQANVTFVGGSVNQGDIAVAAIVINSGSLTLDGTIVTGDNGISVETTEEVSVIVGGTVKATEGYGICQNVIVAKEKGTLNVTRTEIARIEAKTVGVKIINGSYTSESKADRIECPAQTALKIDAGSYNIAGGMFVGFLSFGSGVTGSITGGDYTSDPSEFLKDDYIAVDLAGLYKVAQGTKVGDAYVYAEIVNENDSKVSAADGITVADVPAKTEGAGSAVNKDALLSKAADLKTGDNVEINVSLKAEVKEAVADADGNISSAKYSLTPEIGLSVNGAAAQAIPYDAALLNGGEITVTVPLVSGFIPKEIVHIHADGSEDTYMKGNAASLTEFVVNTDNTVSFKVTSFSDFVMYANELVCEVLDDKGTSQGYYSSFPAARDAIRNNDGWTIKLLQDASVESSLEIVLPWTWTIDLAGNTLSTDSFYIASGGGAHSLTIKDSSAAKSGKITGIGTAAAIDIGGNCVLTLESGTIEHTSGTAIALKDNKNKKSAQLIMNGGAVNGTTAVTASSGTVTINGGEVTGTTGMTEGLAAITVGDNASLTLTGGSVTNANGNAIKVNGASAQFVMNGGAVNGVTAIYAEQGAVEISNGTVTGTNSTVDGEAAILVNDNVTLTIKGGSVTNAKGNAISINGVSSQFTMSGGTVNGRTKGVDMYGGSAEISSGTIEGGTAINTVGSSITISGGTFDSTTADKEVVAATTGSTTVAISGGSFAHAVPADQCADGYMPTKADANGRYGVEPKVEPVAMAQDALGVNKGEFAQIQDAVNAAGFGGKVTLLRDSGQYANVTGISVFDGAGCRMKSLTVQSTATVKVMNLRADVITVSANASVEISSGWYRTHTGSGTYSISGGVFGDEVTQEQCALVPVTGKLTGTAASLTKYIPAQNTDPETKDAYPYTVVVAPAPRITGISNSAYFQKNSNGTLTIYTDGDYDELVKARTIYRCLHVYNANGTDLISSRYYTVEEDANGYAVITISNSFLRNRPTGTYSVQVDFTTGVTQLEDFRVGTSPKTGDESNIGLWIGIMACSAIIIGCGVFVLVHKNKKNKK